MLLSLLQTSAHDKASCNCEQSSGVEISLYNFVSSAYSPVDVDSGVASGRSLMKSKKSIGPKMLPCGMPEVTGDRGEAAPSTTTHWVRLCR
jgi:hypothetical protein